MDRKIFHKNLNKLTRNPGKMKPQNFFVEKTLFSSSQICSGKQPQNWFKVTQGPEQHSPLTCRMAVVQRTKEMRERTQSLVRVRDRARQPLSCPKIMQSQAFLSRLRHDQYLCHWSTRHYWRTRRETRNLDIFFGYNSRTVQWKRTQ